ncbi:MAG: type I-F CRISPR-associated protein Csy1 [Gammaproteobacteria bacterium]
MPQSFSQFLTEHRNEDDSLKSTANFYKELGSYLSPIFSVSFAELDDFLTAHINMIKKTGDPFDKTVARELINNDKIIKECITAIDKGWHTHNLKVPNAKVSGIAGLIADATLIKNADNYPAYLIAHNQVIDKKFAVVGDAAITSQAKLMTLEFYLDDLSVCIAEQLTTNDSPVQQTFKRIGLEPEQLKKLQTAVNRRIQQLTRADIDANSKQVLFPVGNGQYHSISPAQNTGFARQYQNRLKTVEAVEHQFIKRRSLKVGGTNAINGGVYNVEIGGAHRHLLAMPPPRLPNKNSLNNLLNRFAFQGSLFLSAALDFSALLAVREAPSNQTARLRRAAVIQALTHQFLNPATVLQSYFQENPEELELPRFSKANRAEKNWLLGKSLNEPEQQQLYNEAEKRLRKIPLPPNTVLLVPELEHFKILLTQQLQELN